MSRKQWGHGFHTGMEQGYELGEAQGEFGANIEMACKVAFLLDELKNALCDGSNGARIWTIVKLMDDAVRPHAWPIRGNDKSNAESGTANQEAVSS